MKTVCDKNKCCGCYGCVNVCNRNAIRISDSGRSFNAIIDADKCVNCGKCVNICQMNNEVDKKKPVRWLQGWAKETIREESTSGGFATAISKKFAEYGVVISCVFKDGEFVFDVEVNNEFIGRILQMGEGLEIVAPKEVRDIFRERVDKMADLYKNDHQ